MLQCITKEQKSRESVDLQTHTAAAEKAGADNEQPETKNSNSEIFN